MPSALTNSRRAWSRRARLRGWPICRRQTGKRPSSISTRPAARSTCAREQAGAQSLSAPSSTTARPASLRIPCRQSAPRWTPRKTPQEQTAQQAQEDLRVQRAQRAPLVRQAQQVRRVRQARQASTALPVPPALKGHRANAARLVPPALRDRKVCRANRANPASVARLVRRDHKASAARRAQLAQPALAGQQVRKANEENRANKACPARPARRPPSASRLEEASAHHARARPQSAAPLVPSAHKGRKASAAKPGRWGRADRWERRAIPDRRVPKDPEVCAGCPASRGRQEPPAQQARPERRGGKAIRATASTSTTPPHRP